MSNSYDIEFDEVQFYNKKYESAETATLLTREAYAALKESKRIRNARNVYSAMTDTLQAFLNDRYVFLAFTKSQIGPTFPFFQSGANFWPLFFV